KQAGLTVGIAVRTAQHYVEQYKDDGQMRLPRQTLVFGPSSVVNFKLFIVEVKKPGNFSNSRLETDLVKLGKEMQVVLDKLIKKKVESPEVVALLIGGIMEKMDQLQNPFKTYLKDCTKQSKGKKIKECRNFRRDACGGPVAVMKEKINDLH
ncbi:hypothetical protein CU097_002686, partial [Rhizopus azygosporus]